MDGHKVSVIIPVIRSKKAGKCMRSLYADSTFRDFEIVTANDEERIGCPRMVKRLTERAAYPWVMFLGDDVIPLTGLISNAFKAVSRLPDGWGMVGLNDQIHDGEKLATHWMTHKKLLPLLGGEFFHTGYYHTYCDVELITRCKELGRYVFAEDARLIHDHPITSGEEPDDDYKKVYSEDIRRKDFLLFKRRERDNWPENLSLG